MANRTSPSTLEELRKSVVDKERELAELDLILADYHTEHSRLIQELRRLRSQCRDAEEAASSVVAP
ncbi:MAG: hypothetical protein EHM41_03100 [Chloroflexi bacterium]|nr:MAG: hypothetical protein EHM41_03100 [Chloroflexota bacterium]